jgi:enhancer of polycomb-like protein
MSLLSDLDQASLTTDPSIAFSVADVRQQSMVPFRVQQPVRRDTTSRPHPPGHQPQSSLTAQHGNVSMPVQPASATPVSVPTPVKRMQPPASVPQMRISSNGGMRPTVTAATVPSNPPAPQSSSSHNPVAPANGINGIHRSGSTTPQHEVVKTETTANTPSSDTVAQETHAATDVNGVAQGISPLRPKSQNQHHINGYHLAAMNGYSTITNGSQFLHLNNGLSIQQMQNLKSTFASIPTGQDGNAVQPNAGRQIAGSFINHAMPNGANFDVQLGAGANMILKLPSNRQTQWAISPLQRPMTVNGIDSTIVNGSMSPNLNHVHALAVGPPPRTPSANGTRANMRGVTSSIGHAIGTGPVSQLGTHAMSPRLQHSPSSLPLSLSQVQNQPSPPRLPQTPTMTMVSPSLQHQPPVVSSQSGY